MSIIVTTRRRRHLRKEKGEERNLRQLHLLCQPYGPVPNRLKVSLPLARGTAFVLGDSTNCPLIRASKAKIRANPVRADSLSTRTPNRAKTTTWADVARGNSVVEPTRPIRARLARTPTSDTTWRQPMSLNLAGRTATQS